MPRHLSPEELLALAESHGPVDAGHASRCDTCRREAESLRAVVWRVRSVPVPEPSPLFWDHLSLRIRDAVAHEGPVRRPSLAWARWLTTAMPLTAAVALALAVMVSAPDVGPRGLPPGAIEGGLVEATAMAEPEWQFLVGLLESSGDIADEDLPGVEIGEAERLVAELDAGEQAALVQLLEDEVRYNR